MREIKFRAWDKDNKLMLYGGFIGTLFGVFYTVENLEPITLKKHPNATVLQYTGLKDKNGKEIYEGDILSDINGLVGNVIWCHKCVGFQISYTSKEHYCHRCEGDFEIQELEEIEIIGNIYENPELLEENK